MKLFDLNKIKRVLIVRLSSLGDILLSTPLVRSLKKKHPHLKLDFLLREDYKDIFVNNPYINEILSYNPGLNPKQLNYDLIIDLQNNLRSSGIVKKSASPVLKFHKRSLDKFLLVNFKINRLKNLPTIPERFASVIPGFMLDGEGLDLFLDAKYQSSLSKEEKIIGLCPGSRHFTKMWPEEYFVSLGNKLIQNEYKIAVFGGKSDRQICTRIAKHIPGSLNLSNDNLLLRTAADIKNCIAVVCNDSGLMHAACAVKTPVISIFGSSVKEFGFIPYKCTSLILENNSLSCRPCSHIGKEKCPKGHFKCMLDIKPDFVFQNLIDLV